MKRILSIFVIALFLIGLCETGFTGAPRYTSPLNTSPGVGIIEGAGQSLGTPVRKFRAVRFYYHQGTTKDTSVSPDSLVIWDVTASGDDGVTVTSSNVTGDSLVAGVLVTGVSWCSTDAHNLYATDDARYGSLRHWGWMQTSGLAYVLIAKNVISGDMLTQGGCPYRASPYPQFKDAGLSNNILLGTITNDATYHGKIGVALDSGTSTSAGARVRVLLKGLE